MPYVLTDRPTIHNHGSIFKTLAPAIEAMRDKRPTSQNSSPRLASPKEKSLCKLWDVSLCMPRIQCFNFKSTGEGNTLPRKFIRSTSTRLSTTRTSSQHGCGARSGFLSFNMGVLP
ncbi:hypothetical protein SAY86_009816 [Trapa natans]|uniref:Uncharacterized protein n=1 Tax=Trapa natans TaxID=22666 RepID=A0AAN7KXF6_TRANT|nr:hypothetical protein SAY86_009816 [Trapa natans]